MQRLHNHVQDRRHEHEIGDRKRQGFQIGIPEQQQRQSRQHSNERHAAERDDAAGTPHEQSGHGQQNQARSKGGSRLDGKLGEIRPFGFNQIETHERNQEPMRIVFARHPKVPELSEDGRIQDKHGDSKKAGVDPKLMIAFPFANQHPRECGCRLGGAP